jgi:formate/nitrite transporter FocA (FNT family)
VSTQFKQAPAVAPAENAATHDDPQDEPQKSYHTILEQHLEQAQQEIERPAPGLFLSGISAGLDLGFGPLLMAVIASRAGEDLSEGGKAVAMAAAYSVGFVIVVVGRSELFTEQTTSAVLPVLDGRARFAQLLRLWLLVLVGNLIGAAAMGWVVAKLGIAMGIIHDTVIAEMASRMTETSTPVMLASAIAAGWLMGLVAWLVIASRGTASQIVMVAVTTFVIGIAGFHHSIAGTIEVLMSVFADAGASWSDFARFLAVSVVGNAIGGSMFVALLKFGHVRAS